MECAADGGAVSDAPRISSVEPPPMSTTSTGSAGVVAQVPDRAVEGERGLLGAGQHLGRHAEPGADRLDEDVGVLGVAGRRGGAEPEPVDVVLADQRGVLVERGEGARQRLVGQPAGRVDALAEPDDPGLADRDVGQVADQQLDRVGAAVDGGDRSSRHRVAIGVDARAGRPPRPPAGRAPRRRAGSRRGPGPATGRRARAGT